MSVAYRSGIARLLAEVIQTQADHGKLAQRCRDAGLGYEIVRKWRAGLRDAKLSDAEAFLNACGYRLISVPSDKP